MQPTVGPPADGNPESGQGTGQLDHLERQYHRLAFDVHDGVAQTLCAALLQVDALRASLDSNRVELEAATLTALLQDALRELRELVDELHPQALDAATLDQKLQAYVSNLEARGGPAVRLRMEMNGEGLSPSAQIAVFRIVQEALTNVRKHALAESAVVRVWTDSNAINVEVEDQGVGFDPLILDHAIGNTAHGLRGIRERAQLLDGSLSIAAQPGKGTKLSVVIPLWQ